MFPSTTGLFGPFAPAARVVVQAGGGRDIVQIGSTPLAAAFFGGAGDDLLSGGPRGDLLVGGAGYDRIVGGL